jgi:hypothetical protein
MAIRKKRKPMTPEQRAAAGERLRKAREKRMKENPPQYKNIHPLVMERGEDDPFYFRKIQSWIKTQKEELSIARKDLRQKVKGKIWVLCRYALWSTSRTCDTVSLCSASL